MRKNQGHESSQHFFEHQPSKPAAQSRVERPFRLVRPGTGKIPGEINPANRLTKHLDAARRSNALADLGMVDMSCSNLRMLFRDAAQIEFVASLVRACTYAKTDTLEAEFCRSRERTTDMCRASVFLTPNCGSILSGLGFRGRLRPHALEQQTSFENTPARIVLSFQATMTTTDGNLQHFRFLPSGKLA